MATPNGQTYGSGYTCFFHSTKLKKKRKKERLLFQFLAFCSLIFSFNWQSCQQMIAHVIFISTFGLTSFLYFLPRRISTLKNLVNEIIDFLLGEKKNYDMP